MRRKKAGTGSRYFCPTRDWLGRAGRVGQPRGQRNAAAAKSRGEVAEVVAEGRGGEAGREGGGGGEEPGGGELLQAVI